MKKPTYAELLEREEKRRERIQRQNEKFNEGADRINFTVPKGRKADIQEYCQQQGVSVNAFVSDLVLSVVDGRKALIDIPEKDIGK